jgi:hypothetical protein
MIQVHGTYVHRITAVLNLTSQKISVFSSWCSVDCRIRLGSEIQHNTEPLLKIDRNTEVEYVFNMNMYHVSPHEVALG